MIKALKPLIIEWYDAASIAVCLTVGFIHFENE